MDGVHQDSDSAGVGTIFGAGLYDSGQQADLPAEAVAGCLGCGNPTAVADLRVGERVLDLEFRKGTIENIPLSVDKPSVLTEMFRVLAPGGRIGISDVVAENHLSAADRAERGSHVGCIAGALSEREYLDGLAAAGFVEASLSFTHEVADGMHGAIIRARKPE